MQTLDDIDALFLKAFAAFADRLQRSGHTRESLLRAAQPRLSQDNVTAVTDLSRGKGWINHEVAREFSRELGREDADALGAAYAAIRRAVDGKTEPANRHRSAVRQ